MIGRRVNINRVLELASDSDELTETVKIDLLLMELSQYDILGPITDLIDDLLDHRNLIMSTESSSRQLETI
jgi:hypothetical protein